jgi:hypothetical protein
MILCTPANSLSRVADQADGQHSLAPISQLLLDDSRRKWMKTFPTPCQV